MGITAAKKAATKSWKQSLAMAAFQKSWEKEKMQNAYQWTMQDMEKAGLNPILAATNGANMGGSISQGAGDTSGLQSAGQIAAQGLQNIVSGATGMYSQLKGVENQSTMTESDAMIKRAEATKIIAETENLPKKMKSEILRNLAEADKIDTERQHLPAVMNSQVERNMSEAKQRNAERDPKRVLGKYGETILNKVQNFTEPLVEEAGKEIQKYIKKKIHSAKSR